MDYFLALKMLGKAQIFLAACAAFIVAASSVGQVEAHSFPGNDHAFAARGKHHKAAEKWDKELSLIHI